MKYKLGIFANRNFFGSLGQSKECILCPVINWRIAVVILLGFFLTWGVFLSKVSAAANDNFASAENFLINLTTVTSPVRYVSSGAANTTGATLEGAEPSGCRTVSRSVWYKYFSTAAFSVNAETVGSDYDTVLTIYRADDPADITSLVQLGCNDDIAVGTIETSRLTNITFKKNATFFFQVSGYGGSSPGGNLVIHASMTAVDSDITLPTVVIQQPPQNTNPVLTSLNFISGTAADNAGISQVQIFISTGGSNDGEGPGSKYWDGANWVGSQVFFNGFLNSGIGSTNTIWDNHSLPPLQDGVSYYIRAKAKDQSENFSATSLSSFTFSAPTVSHDDFTQAISIPVGALSFQDNSTTTAALPALQKFPSCGAAAGNRDVWYKYVSSSTRAININTSGSNFNNILAVWKTTGSNQAATLPIPVSGSSEVACNLPFTPNAQVQFQLEIGATYYIQSMSEWGSGGSLNLTLSEIAGDAIAPAQVTDLVVTPDITPGSVKLEWTSVGDDGFSGLATGHDIRYSFSGLISNSTDFNAAITITSTPTFSAVPIPVVSGQLQNVFVNNLSLNTTVWFAIQIKDEVFNLSPISNSPQIVVPGGTPNAINFSPGTAKNASFGFADEGLVNTPSPSDIEKAAECGAIPSSTGGDLWYSYLSTATGLNITANTFNSTMDTVLQVWKDTGGLNTSSFIGVTCNDNEGGVQSKINFLTDTIGTTYYAQTLFNIGGTLRFQFGQPDSVKPGQITSLQVVTGSQNGELDLTWIEPADNGSDAASGKVNRYFIRYSSHSSINLSNWSPPFSSTGSVLDIETFPINQIPPSPVTSGNILSYTIRNLKPGATYWVSVRSQDNAGNLANTSNSPFAPAKSPVALATDGKGSVQIRDESGTNILTSVPVSSQVILNIRFTVGSSSITGGGKVSIKIPSLWTPPQVTFPASPGYVTVSTVATLTQLSSLLSVKIGTESSNIGEIIVTVSTQGNLNAGDIINIEYGDGFSQYLKQNGIQFITKSQGSGAGILQEIPVQPSLNAVAGAPTQIGFSDWNNLILGSGQNSPALFLEPKDSSWQQAAAQKNMVVRVWALSWDSVTFTYNYDYNARLSENNFQSLLSSFTISTAAFQGAQFNSSLQTVGNTSFYQLIIPQGESSYPIYYKTTTLGDTILWIEYNDDFETGPSTFTFSRWFKIRPGSVGFNSINVNPSVMTPNSDGTGDFSNITFTPTINDMNWRVVIGTDPVLSNLSSLAGLNIGGGGTGGGVAGGVSASTINVFMERWGFGQPQGITWYGTDFMGNTLPDGTYIIRLEDVGGTVVSSTTVTLDTDFIDVKVLKGSDVSTGAWVTVEGSGQQGGNPFYIHRTKQVPANGTGITRVWGLKSGITYSIFANFFEPSTQKTFSGDATGTVGGGVVTITFGDLAEIRVHATAPSGSQSDFDQWGGVNVEDVNSGFPIGFGSLRIPNNSLESDSGWSPTGFPSSWTVVNVNAPAGGTNYRIRVDIFGFTAVELSTNIKAGTQHDFNIQFVKKPKIFGTIVLPSTNSIAQTGTWVSVEGRKSGESFPSTWGGAWFSGAQFGLAKATGIFNLDVDTGTTYNLKARAFGIGTVSLDNVVISSQDVGTIQLDETNTIEGGNKVVGGVTLAFSTTVTPGIRGDITVLGNSLKKNNPFTLFLSVFSPSNYSYASTQVNLIPSASSTTATFSMPGLDDGTYQIYSFLEGFEVFPPGPKIVNVVNGEGNISLKLQQFAGKLVVQFTTTSAGGYEDITLTVNGPGVTFSTDNIKSLPPPPAVNQASFEEMASSAQVTSPNLGTGFYTLSAQYQGRFLSKKVNVINGSTSTVGFDFSGDVFTITGTVKVESFTFGVTASSSSGIQIGSVDDLVDRSKIGFEPITVGTSSLQLPLARIDAYPRDQRNFGSGILNFVDVGSQGNQGNAGGLTGADTQFGFGQVRNGIIDSSGVYKIENLLPGVYILRHPVNLDPQANYYATTLDGSFETNSADIGNEQKVVLISSNGAVQVLDPIGGDLEFTYKAGSSVSGQILLPADIANDTRFMTLIVQNERREVVSWQSIYLNGGSANYQISNLGDGDYTLVLRDERKGNETNSDSFVFSNQPGFDQNYEKYVARPLSISITGNSLTGQNIQLFRASFVEGKIAIVRISSTNVKTTELISSNNQNLLPSNLRVEAFHDIFGREPLNADSTCCPSVLRIDPDKGTFRISRIFPDTEFRVFLGQRNDRGSEVFGADELGQGKLNVVPVEKTGLTVGAGQILDIGTVELQLGLSITGQVEALQVDKTTIPAANVRIEARPSGTGGDHENRITIFTDSKGSFTISGLSADIRYYDVIFGARDNFEDSFVDFTAAAGIETRYAQKIKRNVDVRQTTQTVDVVMQLGLGTITGRVTTADGGVLRNPFGEVAGFPVAEVIVNKQGDIPSDNPLGDIIVETNLSGNFSVDRLAPGTYDIYALSLGYAVKKVAIQITSTDTTKDFGDIQLETGLELSGEILKPDGTKPSSETDVDILAAASADFQELTIASLKTNAQTGTIDKYTLAGLKSGTTYTLIIFNRAGDTIVPPERFPTGGAGIAITTDTKNFNLTFAPSKPEMFMKGSKTGAQVGGIDQYRFEFESTQALRNKTTSEKSDSYWQSVLTASIGTLSEDPEETNPISPDRKKMIVLYVPPSAATTKVSLNFNSFTNSLQPGTTSNFLINFNFDFFLGLDGQNTTRINAMSGGKITLEGDESQALIPSGAFTKADGSDLEVSSNVSVGVQKASDVETATSSVQGAPSLLPETADKLPPVLARAIKSMRDVKKIAAQNAALKGAPAIKGVAQNADDVVGGNVLGSFYDFFLPAGINRQLSKNATVTLQYSSQSADLNNMNVYFFNDTASTVTATSGASVPPNSYGLEETNRTVDTENNTISVETGHFTVFVVVNSTLSVLVGSVVTVSDPNATSAAFNNSGVNQVTLTKGTTFTYTGITVSGGTSENHSFTLISTGSANAGIIVNAQSHLQTFSLAVSQEQLIDLNDDNLSDVSFIISSIHPSSAVVSIAGLNGLILPDTVDYTGTEIQAFNFPNPFNATIRSFLFTGTKTVGQTTLRAEGATAIRYALPSNLGAGTVKVSLQIYDVSGDLVRRLNFNDRETGKYHYGDWDGRNENGETVASGVYLGQLTIDGSNRRKIFKMAVIK